MEWVGTVRRGIKLHAQKGFLHMRRQLLSAAHMERRAVYRERERWWYGDGGGGGYGVVVDKDGNPYIWCILERKVYVWEVLLVGLFLS